MTITGLPAPSVSAPMSSCSISIICMIWQDSRVMSKFPPLELRPLGCWGLLYSSFQSSLQLMPAELTHTQLHAWSRRHHLHTGFSQQHSHTAVSSQCRAKLHEASTASAGLRCLGIYCGKQGPQEEEEARRRRTPGGRGPQEKEDPRRKGISLPRASPLQKEPFCRWWMAIGTLTTYSSRMLARLAL